LSFKAGGAGFAMNFRHKYLRRLVDEAGRIESMRKTRQAGFEK
jgi:hypothetical protein